MDALKERTGTQTSFFFFFFAAELDVEWEKRTAQGDAEGFLEDYRHERRQSETTALSVSAGSALPSNTQLCLFAVN